MATDKKSFLIYCDVIHSIEHLTNEEKGRLFQHLLEYVNDMNPTLEDRMLIGSWKPIEQQLKRDLVKYESIRERNSKNGSLGGRPKNPNKPTGFSGNPTEPKKADTDTVIDTDNVKDKVTVIDKETKPKIPKEFSEAVRVCFRNCLDFFPEHYKPKNQKITDQWMDTIDKLNTIEKIPFESIEQITKWAREGWWSKNFQSLLKLRKKNSDGIMYLSIFNDGMSAKPVSNGKSTAESRAEINRRIIEDLKNV